MTLFTARTAFDADHDAFRDTVRHFLRAEVEPYLVGWRSAGVVPAEFFHKAGKEELLGTFAPEEFGGGGVDDLRFVAVLVEEAAALGATGLAHLLALHSGVVLPVLLRHANESVCARWVPDLIVGLHLAVPLGAGAPIKAAVEDSRTLLRGHLDGVAGGIGAGMFLTGVTYDGEPELMLLSAEAVGLVRTPIADALGGRESGQADVMLGAVTVDPADGLGLGAWAELSRDLDLWSAIIATASARAVIAMTLQYVTERHVFGRPLATFENTRYRLAEVAARLAATELLVDSCLVARCEDRLSAAGAATACLEAAALHDEVVDRGLQLHGGYGYMREYPISHAFADAQYLRQQECLVGDGRDVIAADLGL